MKGCQATGVIVKRICAGFASGKTEAEDAGMIFILNSRMASEKR
jgi:hypothetical protein